MSASSNAPPQNVVALTQKLYDADSDIRYMSLNDLLTTFGQSTNSAFLSQDYNQCAKIVDGFLHTLNDPNGEVQNLTVKCLGPFVNKAHPEILSPTLHKIANLPTDNTVDSSISALAVRTIVMSLPRPSLGSGRPKAVNDAYSSISKVLIPRLVGYIVLPRSEKNLPDPPKGLLETDLENGSDSNFIDVLTEIAQCYGSMLHPDEVKALQKITIQLLESDRSGSVMKKKAVLSLSILSQQFSDSLLSSVISRIIEKLTDVHLSSANRKLYFNVFGAMARVIPSKFGPHLRTLAPFILSALSKEELDDQMQDSDQEEERVLQVDEVREAALITLDAFVAFCGDEMQRYTEDTLDAVLRYLKYEPNTAVDDDEDDEQLDDSDADEDDFEVDEDFEEEAGIDDDDDLSWKVRRCAAKALHTFVSVRNREIMENGNVYDRIALALVDRFTEREENVRLEVLVTLAFLIRKSGEADVNARLELTNGVEHLLPTQPPSRKRRRGYSDVSMSDTVKIGRFTGSNSPESWSPPRSGAPANLSKLRPEIVNGTLKLLRSSTSPTKQASLALLKDLVVAQKGGLDEFMANLIDLVVNSITTPMVESKSLSVATSASTGSAGATTLQIVALQLLSEIAKTHSSKTIQPYNKKLIPAVVSAMQQKVPKVACEALSTAEQMVKALTPPRWAASNQNSSAQIEQILTAVVDLIRSRTVDLSVRHQAIQVLGMLTGRTLSPQGAKLINDKRRRESFKLLFDSSKNETTRFTAIKSIDTVATLAPEKYNFDPSWFSEVCLELGAQLRKADRSLRGASLGALRTLLTSPGRCSNLDGDSGPQLTALMLPLLTSEDLHMLGPALAIFSALIRDGSKDVVSNDFNQQLCGLVANPIAASLLDPLCELVQQIGKRGLGRALMQSLLKDVGVNGPPAIVGKVIGNLLVSSEGNVGITTEEFLQELQQTTDDRRKCLALSVLGEIGLRSGSSSASALSPDFFMSYFSSESADVPLAAAIALGRASAGSGNVKTWVPSILSRVKQDSDEQYLGLHAIKELLQYNEEDRDIVPFTHPLWEASLAASRSEDSRTIGAECVAILTMIDPNKFLPMLQALLAADAIAARRTAILALRDIFSATDNTYDKDLRPILMEVLTTIMRDSDVETRRIALNTFNAAARNKLHLILPHFGDLQPLIMDQTFIDPSLIREVKMGPFTHKVDDGLELRKGAYETLYSLLEIAPTRIDISKLCDRAVAGIADDHSIRQLCFLLLEKLMIAAPEETKQRLEDLTEVFKPVLAFTPKENAVRHEVEKADDGKKGVVKLTVALHKQFPDEAGSAVAGIPRPKWTEYLGDVRKDHGELIKRTEKEVRERNI